MNFDSDDKMSEDEPIDSMLELLTDDVVDLTRNFTVGDIEPQSAERQSVESTQLRTGDDDGEEDNTEEMIREAMLLPGGPELLGKMLEQTDLPGSINKRQCHRILARRRTKLRLQAARVIHGYIDGGHVRGLASVFDSPRPLVRSPAP